MHNTIPKKYRYKINYFSRYLRDLGFGEEAIVFQPTKRNLY